MSKPGSKHRTSPKKSTPARVPRRWQLQDAKARLSHLIRASRDAPQIITVHGEEVAVVQSIDDFRRERAKSKPPHWLDVLVKCPPGPPLVIDRDSTDVVGAGTKSIFEE